MRGCLLIEPKAQHVQAGVQVVRQRQRGAEHVDLVHHRGYPDTITIIGGCNARRDVLVVRRIELHEHLPRATGLKPAQRRGVRVPHNLTQSEPMA